MVKISAAWHTLLDYTVEKFFRVSIKKVAKTSIVL